MERLQSPKDAFWPYDIFGYLLPGAILCSGLALGLGLGTSLAAIDLASIVSPIP